MERKIIPHQTEADTWQFIKPFIVHNRSTGKFHFIDETSRIDPTPYNTVEECQQELLDYCFMLGYGGKPSKLR